VHVGALAALEDRDVDFRGLAGTSAGAIVAVLRAAGFSSRDMVDPEARTTIMTRLEAIDATMRSPTAFFGQGGWTRVVVFRWVRKRPWFLIAPLAIVAGLPVAGLLTAPHVSDEALALLILAWVLTLLSLDVVARFLLRGLADLDRFTAALSELLRSQLFPAEPNRVVRMSDFGRDGRPTLKIVAANLSRRNLVLFTPDRTPDVPVAEAVSASICLPIIFALRRLAGDTFMDGGIVSNLPAWPFDEERELDPDSVTVAIDMATDGERARRQGLFWPTALLQTGLFGRAELNLRAAGRVEYVPISSGVDVLDFDLPPDAVFTTVREARSAVANVIERRIFLIPEIYRNATESFQVFVARALSESENVVLGSPRGRVRVAVAWPGEDRTRSLQVRYGAGYENDADARVVLPINGSFVGEAWRHSISTSWTEITAEELGLENEQHERLRQSIWTGRRWILCVPIFDPGGERRFIVTVDGDHEFAEGDAASALMSDLIDEAEAYFGEVVSDLASAEESQ
jgi:NTE family protein